MNREETIAHMSNSGVTFYMNRFPEPARKILTIPRDVTEAQLRLMAAAPLLAEALQAVVADLIVENDDDRYDWLCLGCGAQWLEDPDVNSHDATCSFAIASAALASARGEEETP